ncbi:MAG: repeat- protein-like protein [Acidimicrobiales bacterium]|nr:repeat- protein-like protein [Acidimicrobiales bacterium]
MAYDAFISYSHAADDELGPVVQDLLRRLAKPWYRRRALNVFRDETGLSANPDLWKSIVAVLDSSEWFVLLASPAAAASPWVNREIEHWLTHRDRSRILPVLTEGTWVWDPERGDFDRERSTALPAALVGAFTDEPKHVDLAWTRSEQALDARNPRLRDQVAAIAAPIHGIAKDELEGADLREHRRSMRVVRGVVAALVLLAAAAVVGAVAATHNAQRARAARDDSDYRRIVAQSRDLRTTNRTLALLLAVEARHLRDTPQSRNALESALVADQRYLGAIGDGSSYPGSYTLCLLDHDRLGVTGGFDGTIGFADLTTGTPIGSRQRLPGAPPAGADRRYVGCATSDDRQHAVVTAGSRVWRLDARSRRVSGPGRDLGSPPNQLAVSADGRSLLAGTVAGRVVTGPVDPGDGPLRVLATVDRPSGAAFSPDGRTAITTTRTEIVVWDTSTWTVSRRFADLPDDQGGGFVVLKEDSRLVRFSPDGRSIGDSRRAVFRVLDAVSGTERWRAPSIYTAATPFAFAPDSRSVFEAGSSGRIDHRDVRTGTSAETSYDTQEAGFVVPAVTLDGATLLMASSSRTLVQRWALDGHSLISRLIPGAGIQPFGYSPDGRSLLAVPAGTSAVVASKVFDVDSGRLLGAVPSAALPTLVSRAVVGAFFIDELKVDRLDLGSGRRVGPRFAVDISRVNNAGVDRAGRILIANNDGTVDRYEPDGRRLGPPWLKLPRATWFVAISPRGDLAAFMDDTAMTRVVRMSDGRVITAIADLANPNFNGDGSLLTGFSKSSTFRFVDPSTGHDVGARVAVTGRVSYSDFATAQMFVLAGAADAQVYDLQTRQPITDFFPSAGSPVGRPGGRQLATSAARGIVLWDLDPDHWERAACTAAGRNLTPSEWSTYFPSSAYRRSCRP